MSATIRLMTFLCVFGTLLHGQGIDAKNRSISYYLTTEPPTLNTTEGVDSVSSFIIGHTFEGLLRRDKDNKLVPGIAERYKMTDEKAVFHLRKDAKWSDGKPVTAHDFEFAWKTAINPETASPYAFILYVIKNAQDANTGKAKMDDVGVRALDDHTLEVIFDQPCAYFPSLTTFVSYMPIRF